MPFFRPALLSLLSLISVSVVVVAAAGPSPENIALAQKYAPQFRFHKDEVYFPSTVEYFLSGSGVSLYDAKGPLAGAPSPLTKSNLASTANAGQDAFVTLNINSNLNGLLRGQKPGGSAGAPTVYTFVAPKANGVVDLYYWIWCPYNLGKKITLLGYVGDHVGDWERITVRTVNGVATAIDYHAHDDKGSGTVPYAQAPKFLPSSPSSPPTTTTTDPTARPVAYVAQGSHGMWITPGTFTYVDVVVIKLKDVTSDGGVYWDTHDALTTIEYPGTYDGDRSWLNYKGAWGNQGVNDCWWYFVHNECELVSGPGGPVRADVEGAAELRSSKRDGSSLIDQFKLDRPLSQTLATVASNQKSSYTVHLSTPTSGYNTLALKQTCTSSTATPSSTRPLKNHSFAKNKGQKKKNTTSVVAYVPVWYGDKTEYSVDLPGCEKLDSHVSSYTVGLCSGRQDEECLWGPERKVRAYADDVFGPQEVRAVSVHDLDNWSF